MLARHAGHFAKGIVVEHPGRISRRLRRFVGCAVAPLCKLVHRPTLSGIENLPQRGPYLLIANHSAGLGITEIFTFYSLYLERQGERSLAGFALPLDWHIPGLRFLVTAAGAIPSTYEHAHQALEKDVPILLFPGGDHETTRPVWQANRVDFGGRQGFLKIARDGGVPIVPMGIRGSHLTAPILFRSKLLATLLLAPRLIGQKRWGLSLLGVIGSAAILGFASVDLPWRILLTWIWLGSPLTFLPWIPWKISYSIGRPIPAADLFGNGQSLEHALARVQDEVQHLVTPS